MHIALARIQQGFPQRSKSNLKAEFRKVSNLARKSKIASLGLKCDDIIIDKFVRRHVLDLKPYTPILPFEILSEKLGRTCDEIVKLDANENPYGPPPEVYEALKNVQYPHIYPDPESRRLRAALALDCQVPVENLLVGCGADELIDLIMRAVLEPGDKIINTPPTFGMYSFDCNINAGCVIDIPRGSAPDFKVDVSSIERAVAEHNPKLLFLTSPNNPDGSIISKGDLGRLLDLPVIVVLDEAYIEFSSKSSSCISQVSERSNLVVLRTFSKRAALAGLRVGYGAFPLALIDYMWRIKQPYNVSAVAEIAALAALSNPGYLQDVRDKIVSERGRLFDILSSFSFLEPFPSESNFILCR